MSIVYTSFTNKESHKGFNKDTVVVLIVYVVVVIVNVCNCCYFETATVSFCSRVVFTSYVFTAVFAVSKVFTVVVIRYIHAVVVSYNYIV